MDILRKPAQLSLSANLDSFIISSNTSITFALKIADATDYVVQHQYSPDKRNRIEIDLKDIVTPLLHFQLRDTSEPYQQTALARQFTVEITPIDSNQKTEISFTAIRAGVDRLADSPTNFLQANFLTWQPTLKPVTYYTPEFLTYYASQDAIVKCQAFFPASNDGSTPAPQTFILAHLSKNSAWTIPVQYAIIAGKLGKLPTHYDVWVETPSAQKLSYTQRYYASSMRSEEEQWILFENSLGGLDTFRAYGNSENTAKHTHNIAEIENDTEEYRVDTERTFKKNTGFLDIHQRKWLLDFFPSLGKYIYHGNSLRRITVTDSDASYQTNELPSNYSFTYKYADARPLLNIPRQPLPVEVLNIQTPDVESFTVAPRLVEFGRLQLSGGALFPVQNPYADNWSATTADALLEFLTNGIINSYTGDGSIGHTHSNLSLLESLAMFGEYLTVGAKKIAAAKADLATFAKALSADSTDWNKILRKDIPDTAHQLITFLQGLAIGESYSISADGIANLSVAIAKSFRGESFSSGTLGKGYGAWTDASGRGHVETDYLDVRIKQFVTSLELRELSFVGGNFVFSAAGSRIHSVQPIDSSGKIITDGATPFAYRCFMLADDGTTRTMNKWRIGDQAKCRTFDIEKQKQPDGTYQNVENKYYWRLVISLGQQILPDGKQYNYIDLANTLAVSVTYEGNNYNCIGYDDGTTPDVPAQGDKIVQEGSQTDKRRQGIIAILVEGEGTPTTNTYAGVNNYDLSSHLVIAQGPEKFHVSSQIFEIVSPSGASTPMVCYRGGWTPGMICSYYESVTHQGSQWLCIIPKGTTTTAEPSPTSPDWKLQVSKGSDSVSVTLSPSTVILKDVGKAVKVYVDVYTGGNLVPYDSNRFSFQGLTKGLKPIEDKVTWNFSIEGNPKRFFYHLVLKEKANFNLTLPLEHTIDGKKHQCTLAISSVIDGVDGYNATLMPSMLTVSTDANGFVSAGELSSAYTDVKIYKGGQLIEATIKSVFTSPGISASFNGARLNITSISIDPETHQAYANSYVDIIATADNHDFPLRLFITTNVHRVVAKLEVGTNSIKTEVQELGRSVSQVTQTSNRLSWQLMQPRNDVFNLLQGTKTLRTAVANTSGVTILERAINDFSTASGSAPAKGYRDLLSWSSSVDVKPNTFYTLSFYAKGIGSFSTFFYPDCCESSVNSQGKESARPDSAVEFQLSNNYELLWVTFKTLPTAKGLKSIIPVRLYNGSSATYFAPCLIEGKIPSQWRPYRHNPQLNYVISPLAITAAVGDGTVSTIEDPSMGTVRRVVHNSLNGFQLGWQLTENTLLYGKQVTMFIVLKPGTPSTTWRFGGINSGAPGEGSFAFLTEKSSYDDLGDGWRKYYITFHNSEARLWDGHSSFGLNGVIGRLLVHSCGVVVGDECPDWNTSPIERRLAVTGIDIVRGVITLSADKTVIVGNLQLNGTFMGVLRRHCLIIDSTNYQQYIKIAPNSIGITVATISLTEVGSYVIFHPSLNSLFASTQNTVHIILPSLPINVEGRIKDFSTEAEFTEWAKYTRTFIGTRLMFYNNSTVNVQFDGMLYQYTASKVTGTINGKQVTLPFGPPNNQSFTLTLGGLVTFDCFCFNGPAWMKQNPNTIIQEERIAWRYFTGSQADNTSAQRFILSVI